MYLKKFLDTIGPLGLAGLDKEGIPLFLLSRIKLIATILPIMVIFIRFVFAYVPCLRDRIWRIRNSDFKPKLVPFNA